MESFNINYNNEIIRQGAEYTELACMIGSELYDMVTNLRSENSKIVKSGQLYIYFARLYRIVTNKSLVNLAFDYYDTFIEKIVKCFISNLQNADITEVRDKATKFKGESLYKFMTTINDYSNDYLNLLECDFGRKLTTLCSLLLCVPFINKCGITPEALGVDEVTHHLMRKDFYKKGLSVPGVILEASSSIFLKLTEAMRVGPSALYVSRGDHEEFEKLYLWLRRNKDNFSCRTEVLAPDGSPDPFTLEGYNSKCAQAIDLADKILPSVNKHPYAKARLEKQKYDITLYQSECCAELRANERRPCPYAVMLCGPPSVGKTTIKEVIMKTLHDADNHSGRFEVAYKPDLVYNYNPNDEYYSGFSTAHTGIVLDDVAQKRSSIMKALGGDDINDLIRIINPQPFSPNQAELHKKGKTPMRCRYVVATTNQEDLHAQHVFSCPGAVYRRFVFIECSVKTQYRDEIGIGLRGDLENPTNIDLWDFNVVKHFSNSSGTSKRYLDIEATKENGRIMWVSSKTNSIGIRDLCHFLSSDLDRHWKSQEQSTNCIDTLYDSEKCSCGISKYICQDSCWKAQASSTWFNRLFVDPLLYAQSLGAFMGAFFIIPFLTFSGILENFWPSKPVSKPRFTTRIALKLIPYLPDSYCVRRLRLLNVLPERIVDKFLGHFWIDFAEKYLTLQSGYDFFRTYVVEDWRFSTVVLFLCIFTFLRRTYKVLNSFSGNAMQSKMPEPDSDEKVRRNYWIRENKIGEFPREGSTISEYDLNNQVMLNNVLIDFGDYACNAFIVCGNLIATTGHQCSKIPDEVTIRRLHKNGQYNSVTFKCDASNCYIDVDKDIMYIKSNRIIPGRNLYKYLPSIKEDIHINCPGRLHYVDPHDKGHNLMNVIRIYANGSRVQKYEYEGRSYSADSKLIAKYSEPGFDGLCGAPVVCVQGDHKMICGFHCASNRSLSLVTPVFKEYIDDVKSKFTGLEPLDDNDLDIAKVMNADAMKIDHVHPKCITNTLEGEYHVIGGSSLPRAKFRTHVERTPFSDEILSYYKDNTEFKSINYTSPIKCDPKEATRINMEKAVVNANFYPEEIQIAVDSMSKEFIAKIKDLKRLTVYPMSVAVNGCDGIPYIDRLNLSTSGGYGHSGPKKNLFDLDNSTDHHAVNYSIGDELQAEVDYIIEQYKNGREANPVFKSSFKDEPITFEKARINKVRIFTGSPTAFSIVARKYLLCIIREFVGIHRLNFEMAIGANAHGHDWEEIYNHVVRHGKEYCFAGDYKSFDKQMPPELILAAFEVIINILKAAGWDDDDIRVVRGIATDTAFPTTELFGTLVQFYGANPSGHVLTTPINSLVNSLYMRMAVRRIFRKMKRVDEFDSLKFNDIMSLVTYGDDNCGSINRKYAFVNHTTIQQALSEVGIIYTMDQKDALSKRFVHISSITFLKRYFVYNSDLNRICAPLVEDSIFKCLTVWTRSRAICKEEQMAAVLSSMNREYFFYGREIFESRHKLFLKVIDKFKLHPYMMGELEDYDSIRLSLGLY